MIYVSIYLLIGMGLSELADKGYRKDGLRIDFGKYLTGTFLWPLIILSIVYTLLKQKGDDEDVY